MSIELPSASLDCLDVLVAHGALLLDPSAMGNLACASPALRKSTELAFKQLFQTVASLKAARRGVTWNHEEGLLPCFANPAPHVIARCGWGGACKCLFTTACAHCGGIGSAANPFTMLRTCSACARSVQSSFVCTVTKAKEHFLLSAKDVRDMGAIAVPAIPCFGRTADGMTTPMLLLSAVVDAAVEKHGDADKLAAQIEAKEAAALARYSKTLSTDKPMKKKPKIAGMTKRPLNALASINSWQGNDMTIGYVSPRTRRVYKQGRFTNVSEWVYKHCTPCRLAACRQCGSEEQMIIHEGLEHRGTISGKMQNFDNVNEFTPRDAPTCRIPTALAALPELAELMKGAQMQHGGECHEGPWNFVTMKNCLFTFGGCRIAVDLYLSGSHEDGTNGYLRIYGGRSEAGSPAASLVNRSFGVFDGGSSEASTATFAALTTALGLQETTPACLIAMLLAHTEIPAHLQAVQAELLNALLCRATTTEVMLQREDFQAAAAARGSAEGGAQATVTTFKQLREEGLSKKEAMARLHERAAGDERQHAEDERQRVEAKERMAQARGAVFCAGEVPCASICSTMPVFAGALNHLMEVRYARSSGGWRRWPTNALRFGLSRTVCLRE